MRYYVERKRFTCLFENFAVQGHESQQNWGYFP